MDTQSRHGALALFAALAAGCARAITPLAGLDAASRADAVAADAVRGADAARDDAAVLADRAPPDGPGDVARGPDAVDVTLPAGDGTWFVDVWRIVRWQDPVDPGVVLDDLDQPGTFGGAPHALRANGFLLLSDTQFDFTAGMLVDEHFAPDPRAIDPRAATRAYGFSCTGVLGATSFACPTGAIPLRRNADGSMTLTDPVTGGEATLIRALLAEGGALDLTVRATILPSAAGSRPLEHPRVAIAWDAPGAGYVFTSDAPLVFARDGHADVELVPAAAARDGDAWLGYVIAYDDRHAGGGFEPGSGDELRGISPVQIYDADDATPLGRTNRGLQMVHLHANVPSGEPRVVVFNGPDHIAPDVAVMPGVLPLAALPDVVR